MSYLCKRTTNFFDNKSHVRRHDSDYTGAQAPESRNDSTAGTQHGECGNTGTPILVPIGLFASLIANNIEDETNFLLDCPAYSQVRNIFFSKIESKLPLLRLLPHETLISHLMNSTDYFVNTQLISFISACFEMRDNLVTMITTSKS